jgi:hypothetical protein
LRAFCLSAPGVRFSALEIAETGVFSFECFFSALSSCAVHSRRVTRLAIVQDSLLILDRAIYQILDRAQGAFSNIHKKPETVLQVGHISEEHCPESKTSSAD